jgi:hypothetical protein
MTDRQLPEDATARTAYEKWMRYRPLIGDLPWKWIPKEGQESVTPNQQQSGSVQCTVTEEYIAACNHREKMRPPEKKPMIERAPITLESLMSVIKEYVSPEVTLLKSTASGDAALTIDFSSRRKAQAEFASNVGIDLEVPPPKPKPQPAIKKNGGGPFKYHNTPTLDGIVFYRSEHEGNRVYGFIPRTVRMQHVKALLRDARITFSSPMSTCKEGVQGTRIVIDEGCVPTLSKLTTVWPTPAIPREAQPATVASTGAAV